MINFPVITFDVNDLLKKYQKSLSAIDPSFGVINKAKTKIRETINDPSLCMSLFKMLSTPKNSMISHQSLDTLQRMPGSIEVTAVDL